MFKNYVNIRDQHLNTYSYNCGGGMTGGYDRKTVKRCEGYALITLESAEWHSQEPIVAKYKTDVKVLDELEAVVRKHRMNFWNRKKFTDMFVSDGENYSYNFSFDKADISFSSQIYPLQYREKLNELKSIIEKYIQAGEEFKD